MSWTLKCLILKNLNDSYYQKHENATFLESFNQNNFSNK
jgi:hypothetical protein